MSDFYTVWITLFGVYSPIQYVAEDGSVQLMTDWGYISRVAFFMLVVFCVLKLIGGLLNGKR